MRGAEGAAHYERFAERQDARDRMDLRRLERLVEAHLGRIAGSRRASIVLPEPGGPTSDDRQA
jgi:hypothetical protein